MIDSTADLGTIPASGSANNALDPFEMRADTTTPLEHEAVMTLKLTADGTYAVDRYFHLTIGQGVVYFSFDGEGSDSGWTHGPVTPGFGDQWHLSTEMCSSPTHAWKCGSMGMAGYALHLDAGLVSPAVEITPYSALYYSHWMDAEPSAVYGDSAYDGGIIEVSSAGGPFVQVTPSEGHAGWFCTVRMGLPYTGPMPGRPCYSGNIYWNQTRVDLSAYTGQTIRVRFRFGSDNDTVATEEGWYVDDIFIRGQAPPPRVVQFSFEPDSAFTQLGDTVILCGIIAASELMRGFTVYLGYDTSKVDFIDAAPGLLIEGRIGLQFYFYDHVPVLPDRLDIGAAVYGEDYWAGPGELFRARFVLRGCGDEPIVNAYAPRFVAPDGTTLPWSFEPALFLICDRVPQAPSGVKIIALPSDTVQLWWNPVTRDTLDRPLFAPTQYRVYRAQIFPAAGGPTLVLTTNDTTSVDSVGEGDAYQNHVTAETP